MIHKQERWGSKVKEHERLCVVHVKAPRLANPPSSSWPNYIYVRDSSHGVALKLAIHYFMWFLTRQNKNKNALAIQTILKTMPIVKRTSTMARDSWHSGKIIW
jgi:hypothetical protein